MHYIFSFDKINFIYSTVPRLHSAIAEQLVSKMKHELHFDNSAPCRAEHELHFDDSAPYRADSPTNCAWDKMSDSSPSEFCSAPEDASDDDSDATESVSQSSGIVPGMLSHYCVICASHMVRVLLNDWPAGDIC